MAVIKAPQQTHDAIIAYENLALDATSITGTAPDTGFALANLFNYFTFDGYKPNASGTANVDITLSASAPCDYFAFYNQDLFEYGGTIKLQYWDGGGWVDCFSAYTPVDNSPQLITFTEVNSDQYRIVFDSPTAAILSCASFGKSLPIPYGLATSFASPHNGQQYVDISNISESGNFIGRSTYKEAVEFSVSTELLEYDWFRANWRPFMRHLERRPFWFKWSDTTYTDEAVFCWNNGKQSTPVFTGSQFMSFSLSLKGLVS